MHIWNFDGRLDLFFSRYCGDSECGICPAIIPTYKLNEVYPELPKNFINLNPFLDKIAIMQALLDE